MNKLDKKAEMAQKLADFLEEHQADRVVAPRMKSGKFSMEELREMVKEEGKEKEESESKE